MTHQIFSHPAAAPISVSRRDMLRTAVAASASVMLAGQANAQEWYMPERGSPERRAILNALRPAIVAEMRGDVEFVIIDMRILGPWAAMIVEPQRPGGAAIDPLTTGHAEDVDFMDGLTVYALCLFDQDRWNLIDHATGPTDVAYAHWPRLYGVPSEIYGS